ncbi:acyltransferase [Pedobacter nototheniae]|uniref:acyltransferase family protein n=1 Tax=Pedobacter nototheniae TaxID=2488994 RepID=UPI00292E238A|nr:acyltransferase [Pedobacter nototheniae]
MYNSQIKPLHRLKNIDFLRGIAALSVTYFHLSGSTFVSQELGKTGKFGYLGVEIFFIVSGFIIPISMNNRNFQLSQTPGFLLKRMARISPPYLIIIILSLILILLSKRPFPNFKTIISHIGYLNDVLGLKWISPVFWTLAIEFQFYIFLGLSYNFMVKNNYGTLVLFALILFLSSFTTSAYLPYWFSMFALGILTFKKLYLNLNIYIFWISVAIICIFTFYHNGFPEALISLFTVLFILYVRINVTNLFTKLILWLGTISYSLYLTHWDFGRTSMSISKYILHENFPIISLIFGLIVSISMAWVFYASIEVPALKFSKKILYKKKY